MLKFSAVSHLTFTLYDFPATPDEKVIYFYVRNGLSLMLLSLIKENVPAPSSTNIWNELTGQPPLSFGPLQLTVKVVLVVDLTIGGDRPVGV